MECFAGLTLHSVDALSAALKKQLAARPVVLCVGSDRVTGDCIGPIVGHLLKSRYNVPTFVYGGLDCPVHARNLHDTAAFIAARHTEPLLVVDASVGSREDVGTIRLFRGAVHPGSALGRDLGGIGDVGLTATVAPKNTDLATVRLHLVQTMSETIAAAIANAITVFDYYHYTSNSLKPQLQSH